jgi:hypothetical protein
LQGKEYGPSYSNATRKVKLIFVPKSLVDTWFGFFSSIKYKLVGAEYGPDTNQ